MLSSIAASSPTSCVLPSTLFVFNKFVKLHTPFNSIQRNASVPSNLILTKSNGSRTDFQLSEEPSGSQWEFVDNDEIGEDEQGNPWEGAIVYRRNASISHLEYSTTLERLGLGKVSSEVSKIRASEMGLSLVKPIKDSPAGTPVLISIDVTRRKHWLKLDGIARTVLALNCNRCGEHAAQSIYSDFSLLLCEEPIREPDTINMAVPSRDQKLKTIEITEESEENEDASIELDDQLYFPQHEKGIDISKNIRDLLHVEINISAVCDPNCKGLCLKCGVNLNITSCSCENREIERKGYGPLSHLQKQMQQI